MTGAEVSSAPRSLNCELAELTLQVARASGVNFFEVLYQDMDDVIFFLNYLIENANEQPPQPVSENGESKDPFWDYV